MAIILPQIHVLDNANLGRLCQDFFSGMASRRASARAFLARTTDCGVYLGLTTTALIECFAHGNKAEVRDRYALLGELPCIAWIRPYARSWFVGDYLDVLAYEMHEAFHGSKLTGSELVSHIRPTLWETGTGKDMFEGPHQDRIWSFFQSRAAAQKEKEVYTASIVRSEPTGIEKLKLRDLASMPIRDQEKRAEYLQYMVRSRADMIKQHGDEKLAGRELRSSEDFYVGVLQLLEGLSEDNLVSSISKRFQIPRHLVRDSMTIEQFSGLVELSLHLKAVGEWLVPSVHANLENISLDSLPTLRFEQELKLVQKRADRMRGSDSSDSRQAAIAWYADSVEVDKRTFDYVRQLACKDKFFSQVQNRLVKSKHYSKMLPSACET